jgi:hypothetical protein
MTPTGLHQYLIAENKALKVELASLHYLITEILMEIRKPTPTQQSDIQVPETASAPPSQQPMEQKWKRMTLGDLLPMPRPPTKAIQAASLNPPNPLTTPPNPATPPPRNEDTEMQLVLDAETDPTAIASDSDGFSNLIGKRALRWRRRSLEKCRVEEEVGTATGTGSGHGTTSTKDREDTGEVREGDAPSYPSK